MFCTHCGASNPDHASFCTACGKQVGVPPPQSIPPQPRSHRLRNLTLIAAGIAAVIIVVNLSSIPSLLSGPRPEDSLGKAGAAFAHQDAKAFDDYVDVQSVLGDWTDQAASSLIGNNNSSIGETLIANGVVTGFKSLVLPRLVSSVEQEVLSNRPPDETQPGNSSDASSYMTVFITNGIRALIASQLTYQGIASQTRSGSDAALDVRMRSPFSSNPLIIRVNMRRAGDHWRIVAIPNMAGLLAQLHQAK
jgi:hypothetical protein